MIQLAIFDLGKVLIDFDFTVAIQRIRKVQPLDLFKVKSLFQNSALARRWDKGLVPEQEFYSQVSHALKLTTTLEEFRVIWNEIFTEKREMIELAGQFRQRGKTAVISNTNPWHAEYIRRTYPWINSFDHFIASCDVHLLKPDPRIFQIALEKTGIHAENALYLDDIEENVRAARELGINSFHFTGYKSLAKELKDRGILNT